MFRTSKSSPRTLVLKGLNLPGKGSVPTVRGLAPPAVVLAVGMDEDAPGHVHVAREGTTTLPGGIL